MNTPQISIYLDKRRSKANGKFPLKLRVYQNSPRKQKLYPTKYEFDEKEFNSIWITLKPRVEHKEIRRKLQALELKAISVADDLVPFSFDLFEKRLYQKAGQSINISYLYQKTIEKLEKRGQLNTASSYGLALKSFGTFVNETKEIKINTVTLNDIDVDWLEDYQYFMTKTKKLSITTVGIYLRTLRAIFNIAIDNKDFDKEQYPFGRRKYQIPTSKRVKKTLDKGQLRKLFHAKCDTPDQEKARDFWFFSYACSGMNVKDICLIKQKNISGGTLEFTRAKTSRTSSSNSKPIIVHLNDFAQSVVKKYGNEIKKPDAYVFDILNQCKSPQQERALIQNFTRYINQHIKSLAKNIGLPEEISTYWARHSFTTMAVRNGASMEEIQESLGHSDLKTTQNYFAGFDQETKKEIATQIMNF